MLLLGSRGSARILLRNIVFSDPLYDGFDKAHRRDYVRMVISQGTTLAARMEVDANMALSTFEP